VANRVAGNSSTGMHRQPSVRRKLFRRPSRSPFSSLGSRAHIKHPEHPKLPVTNSLQIWGEHTYRVALHSFKALVQQMTIFCNSVLSYPVGTMLCRVRAFSSSSKQCGALEFQCIPHCPAPKIDRPLVSAHLPQAVGMLAVGLAANCSAKRIARLSRHLSTKSSHGILLLPNPFRRQ